MPTFLNEKSAETTPFLDILPKLPKLDIFASVYYGKCLFFEVLGRYYGKSLERLLFWPYVFSLVFSFLENRGKTFWGKWGKYVFRGKYSTHPSTVRILILCKSPNAWSWLGVLAILDDFCRPLKNRGKNRFLSLFKYLMAIFVCGHSLIKSGLIVSQPNKKCYGFA